MALEPDAQQEPRDLVVRDLVASDRAAWDGLWAVYLEHYGQVLAPEVTDGTFRRLTDPEGDPRMWGLAAAAADGAVLGIAHYVIGPSTWGLREDAYLEDLVVSPDARGRGVGHALIAELVRRGRQLGWRRVHWLTDSGNLRARRLYDDVGQLTPYVQYEIRLDGDSNVGEQGIG